MEELLCNLGVAPGTAPVDGRRRLHLIACHDSTLIPLLQAWRVFGGAARRWPGFCACLIVELYEPAAAARGDGDGGGTRAADGATDGAGGGGAGERRVVRVLYDRKPLVVPGAASEWCPLDVFWRACTAFVRREWVHWRAV